MPARESHKERAHSELSASGAARWMNCPGAVRMSRGVAQHESVYAAEGTAAHEVANLCLAEVRDAKSFLGQKFGDHQVTPAMAASVQTYIEYCREKIDACDQYWLEHAFTLAKLNPKAQMFGTADFASYSKRRRELSVVDLKFGRGTWVSAKRNVQMLYYALGVTLSIDEPVSRVSMTIVQPRFNSGDPIRSWSIDAIELAEFSFELMAAAHAALEPDAPTRAGTWCRFCPAQNSCLSFQNMKANAAYHEFKLTDVDDAGASTSVSM